MCTTLLSRVGTNDLHRKPGRTRQSDYKRFRAIITEQEQLPYRTLIDRIERAYDVHRHTYAYDILFMDGEQRKRTTVRNDNESTKKREGVRGYVDRMYAVQGRLF